MKYNWQFTDWPSFKYSIEDLHQALYQYAQLSGKVTRSLESLDETIRQDAIIEKMVEEAIKTSKIEGEVFNPEDIRSSIRNCLNLNHPNIRIVDPKAEGIANLMLSLHDTYNKSLTETMLFEWHKLIFKEDKYTQLKLGQWRDTKEPMQIISGAIGREKIYFEAPPSNIVPREMATFINWFNRIDANSIPGPVRAGIAHIYFESIHPFEDGNGRIGRAISEKILSQDLGYPSIFSLSNVLYKHRKEYYARLNEASHTLEITPWLTFFVNVVFEAQKESEQEIKYIVLKANFWKRHKDSLNERQTKVLQRMFKEGSKGFQGGISARNFMTIVDCSKATATRDLGEMVEKGCLRKLTASGRSTSYEINL